MLRARGVRAVILSTDAPSQSWLLPTAGVAGVVA
jgi:hypothetical protein